MPKKKKSTSKNPVRRAQKPLDADLLIELGTEELPPKALLRLSESFYATITAMLVESGLVDGVSEHARAYATPRRLAVWVPGVRLRQPDRHSERRGPAEGVAFGPDGAPTKALLGFARSCGVAPEALARADGYVWSRVSVKGEDARKLLPGILAKAAHALPVPKRMHWGELDEEFVRPVHWLVVLHGERVIPCTLFGVEAGRESRGHRFHRPRPLPVKHPGLYAGVLKRQGMVVADFEQRRALIRAGAESLAKQAGGVAVIAERLLDEVTGLVEWPEPLLGGFDKAFLDVPAEVLVTTMQDNQKYFPVTSARGKLLPLFVTVANIRSRNPAKVRAGNERVLRARLSDARFFWDTDRKTPLAERVPRLKDIVFHVKLGSMHDRVQRLRRLAAAVARQMSADTDLVERAAELAKADLVTGMVGEFPELQGVMGRYYALHDGERAEVASAIDEHYLPRAAGDILPATAIGQALGIADKLDTVLGIFGVGELPTGDKDPYGLRRAALGALRIMIECRLELDLPALLEAGVEGFDGRVRSDGLAAKVYDFMMERLRAYYQDGGITGDVFDAVLARRPARPYDFDRRVHAVMAFRKMKEAASLTAANKRIHNILKQGGEADWDHVSATLLENDAERRLAQRVSELAEELDPLFAAGDYTQAMKRLAGLKPDVDAFFDEVMVMVDEEAVRDNRLALLSGLGALFLRVADLSRLQT